MKKLLFAGMLLMSVAAIHATNQKADVKSSYAFAQSHWSNINDTIPNDSIPSDTTVTTDTTTEETSPVDSTFR
jgi:hypothetical protein